LLLLLILYVFDNAPSVVRKKKRIVGAEMDCIIVSTVEWT